MKLKQIILAIALVLMGAMRVSAQPMAPDSLEKRFTYYGSYCSPEKLYLHLDRTYYLAGEKIWFMGYLENASQISQLPTSNYIYVELLGSKGVSVQRVKIKKDKTGGFPGYMELPENFKSGNYTLRAYTLWQLNNHPEYLFHQEIKILGNGGKKNEPVNPSPKIEVTFYPEGGRYFADHLSKIGFKALNANGMSVEVRGVVVDSDGEMVTAASTAHDGMGFFFFTPESGKKYVFKVENVGNFTLPTPSEDGATINLNFVPEYVYVRAVASSKGKYNLFLRNDNNMKHIAAVSVGGEKERKYKIERKSLEEGINHLLLLDENGNIVAERLFYVYGNQASHLSCSLEVTSNSGEARSLINTGFSLQDRSGMPVDGAFSISVIRGSFRNYVQRDDIISYMKLSSEIKGHINAPGYYFDDSVPEFERASRLDLLLMIQGWRFYNLKSVFEGGENAFHQNWAKEYWQSIRGEISNFFNNGADPKNFTFSVFSPKLKGLKTQEVKGKSRHFLIDSLDFAENTGFVIKVDRQKGINNYEPVWSGDLFADKYQYHDKAGRYALTTAAKDEAIALQQDDGMRDTLEAAVVVARSYKDPFDEDFTSDGKYASDIESYAEHTLLEYIQMRQPRFVYDPIEQKMENHMNDITRAEGSSTVYTVKLIVDGIEQTWDMFDDLKMEDLEKIEISNDPSTFYNAMGGYISIKIRSGVNLKSKSSETEPSMQYFVPMGYQVADYFYSPRYDRGDTFEDFDHRHTIYWNPEVKVIGGKASVDFCNTDQLDYPYFVRIEGRSKDGRWFTLHKTIEK